MASEILMPRLGWSMEEGVFGGWLKQDGETVRAGDLIFTVEGDKATQEVEAFDNGVLRIPPNGPQPGDIIPVGARLAFILRPGESIPAEGSNVKRQSKIQNLKSKIAISPRARRVAHALGVDWMQLTGSGATGRIVERDIRAAATQTTQQNRAQRRTQRAPAPGRDATPVAQRMAQEAGINLSDLVAQRAGGKIDRADVEAAIAAHTAAKPGSAPEGNSTSETIPVTRIRRLTAQRMVESAHTTAPVTLTTEADATALVALRQQIKSALTARNLPVPSYNDLLIKLVAIALYEHPLLNATWTEQEILVHEDIHIGLAVDTAEGLIVPVVQSVATKSLRQIAVETKSLIERAHARQLSPDDLQGGTFTITNLGMYNIDVFTPIINLPQCAILGVGRIVKRPAVIDDEIVPRQLITLSLTFDHRIVDGAPAARFLNTVREYVEEPVLWLVG
jgi:pyruvate dehydrogenase E2 component (dihydrolipoamide acetyltransferase)